MADALPFKCAVCGEAYDSDSLTKLQQLEFLASWLTEHAVLIGDSLSAELRGEAQGQRQSMRLSKTAAPALHVPFVRRKGPAEEIAHEHALVEATLGRLQEWAQPSDMSVNVTTELRQYLLALSEDLR